MTRRIAVVGGAGAFGRSLVQGLLETTDCDVIVCGRSRDKAEQFAASLGALRGRVTAVAIDRQSADASTISQLKAFCVVDAAGPFQDSSLNFARAVIEAGCHYADLADARGFVAKFPQLDELAKLRGVLAVSGASSTPALSMAVIEALTDGWLRVDEVETVILPSGRAQMGLSVVQAILSYVGRPVRLLRHGRWTVAPGWGLLARRRFTGLGWRFASLVETPDLDLVPARFAALRSAVFYANVEVSVMHLGLWALSFLVRLKLVKSLVPFAGALHGLTQLLRRFGSDRGGMSVCVEGVNADARLVRAQWSLIADAGHGPHIPALPALCVVRGLLDGSVSRRGALACTGIVDLASIEEQFKRFAIRTTRSETALRCSAG